MYWQYCFYILFPPFMRPFLCTTWSANSVFQLLDKFAFPITRQIRSSNWSNIKSCGCSTPIRDVFLTPRRDVFSTPRRDVFSTPRCCCFSTPRRGSFSTPKQGACSMVMIDRAVQLTVKQVLKLREMSHLYEMYQQGIDIKSIQWDQH